MLKSFLIVTFFVTLLSPVGSYSKTLTVKTKTILLMSGPGKTYKSKWEYDRGFPLKILSSKGSWTKVEDFENDSGWIPTESLSDRPAVIVKANKHTQAKVNIRSGPGFKYKVIGKAFYGVVFEKVKQKKGWTMVHHDSGLTGWIKNTLLWGNN